MKIPEKCSMETLETAIEDFESGCHHVSYGIFYHECGAQIGYSVGNISFHDGPECSGTGEVTTMKIPFCPRCEEGVPDTIFTCVHSPIPFVEHDKILDRLFMLLIKGNIFSLILGGAIGALITYLILHR